MTTNEITSLNCTDCGHDLSHHTRQAIREHRSCWANFGCDCQVIYTEAQVKKMKREAQS